jgi:DnaJ family protein C protein 7
VTYSDALRINTNSPDILVLRGRVLFLCGKLEQAKTHAQNALRLDPSCEPAVKLRKRVREVERLKEEGNSAFKLGKLQEAVEKYTEALDVRLSGNPHTPFILTFTNIQPLVYWRSGGRG